LEPQSIPAILTFFPADIPPPTPATNSAVLLNFGVAIYLPSMLFSWPIVGRCPLLRRQPPPGLRLSTGGVVQGTVRGVRCGRPGEECGRAGGVAP
jgi:hypothetical protein